MSLKLLKFCNIHYSVSSQNYLVGALQMSGILIIRDSFEALNYIMKAGLCSYLSNSHMYSTEAPITL